MSRGALDSTFCHKAQESRPSCGYGETVVWRKEDPLPAVFVSLFRHVCISKNQNSKAKYVNAL
jgi:hypothetical protein